MSLKVVFSFLSRIFYGWRMVGLVSAIRISGGGLHQFGFTVFFLPISQDLGLSRTTTSLAFSLSRAQGAIEAPLVGYLIDRYGPRPILVTAVFLAGVGYILLSWVNSYTSFMIVYLGVICLAFVAGFIHSPMVVANSWFIGQRARAMTVVSAAVPIDGALISPLLAIGVTSISWRWAAFASGCIFLLVCLPLSFQLKRSPESMGLLPDGDVAPADTGAISSADTTNKNANADLTSRQAMKTWVFWVLVVSMTARVTCYSAATVHFVPLMVWKGLSEGAAASLLGAFAFANLVAHFVLGWVADRVNKPKLLAVCQPASTGSLHAAAFVGLGQLATLVFHHRVYFVGCLVSHRLGNGGRFFRPSPFRDGQGIDEFLLYVGKLCRSCARWRDLRPD
jgi:sugar phosphate permease